jgi:adenylosuccinate synthase
MSNIAVFGTQFGDEAKSRTANWLAKQYDWVIRVSGSSNAGHTLYHQGHKIVRHLLPSADFSIPTQKAFLGSGMVINLDELLQEVLETEKLFPGAASRIIVDPDAFVVLPKHIEEDKVKNKHIGSTNKGTTPAFKDRVGRTGVKVRQLLQDKIEVVQKLQDLGVQFKYSLELHEEFAASKLLFEGSQSIFLDYNFGPYPFVTSGECGLGGVMQSGFAKFMPSKILGICKPYLTKSGGGEGPFITEMPSEEAQLLRELGGEIGATTSRPRRIGYLDLPMLKYSVLKGSITSLVLTKLDILNGQRSIKVCASYEAPMVSGNDYATAKPIYLDLPGWKDARDPLQTGAFIRYMENYVGVPMEYISVGVKDEDMMKWGE